MVSFFEVVGYNSTELSRVYVELRAVPVSTPGARHCLGFRAWWSNLVLICVIAACEPFWHAAATLN